MSEDLKFRKLAVARVNNAIRMLRLIGNLSNKSFYSYTSKDALKIINALQTELTVVKSKFQNPKGNRSTSEFSLD